MTKHLLACGHAANAVDAHGNGVCVICAGHAGVNEPVAPPDLTGRRAYCTCGRAEPSTLDLAFFEYRGPGSRSATDICECGYARVAHEQEPTRTRFNVVADDRCAGFRPRGPRDDAFYCGCRGWD